jgi:hypothetical protein
VKQRLLAAAALVGGALVAISGTALAANSGLSQISSDPFTNTTSYHKTQVEPDSFAYGSTIVAAIQTGRFRNGGSSDIGWATSSDGGSTWQHGYLPGLTSQVDPASPYERVSDPSVAYDARHNVWLISSIPLLPNTAVPVIFVSRSTDGGLTWGNPVSFAPSSGKVDLDKNWTVCDNNASSPFYGNCYTEFDNFARDDLELMSTSTDGGATWSEPLAPADNSRGLGGQPVVQPNGTVIVPFETISGKIAAFRSTDGGASWSGGLTVSKIKFHGVAGSLRTSPLPSAEIDAAGNVYVAWEDCRFEDHCSANDIVLSQSNDGVNWSEVTRVPIDGVGSGVDHFIPGLAVDKTTAGPGAHLALTYYYYPDAACTGATCELNAGFVSSADGGATWSTGLHLAGPMALAWLPLSSQGYMVGDYISTSFTADGLAHPLLSVASAPRRGLFQEAMFSSSSGLAVGAGTVAASSKGANDSTISTGSTSLKVR